MNPLARLFCEVLVAAFMSPKPLPPRPRRQVPIPGSARDQTYRADLYAIVEDLRVFVGKCEADWKLNDRLDLAERVRRDA